MACTSRLKNLKRGREDKQMKWQSASECGEMLSEAATQALIQEVALSPKPGLVDKYQNGSHTDLNYRLMYRSAEALQNPFYHIAKRAYEAELNQALREDIGQIGRVAEKNMFLATEGVNTHKGAIWALGLFTAVMASMNSEEISRKRLARLVGGLALLKDPSAGAAKTNGRQAEIQYNISGAKGEAGSGFPHVTEVGLPMLWNSRKKGFTEKTSRLNTLVAIMASLSDTCVLHRAGSEALASMHDKASLILLSGGVAYKDGRDLLLELDKELIEKNASPGGCADMLAATLYIDAVCFNSLKTSNDLKYLRKEKHIHEYTHAGVSR